MDEQRRDSGRTIAVTGVRAQPGTSTVADVTDTAWITPTAAGMGLALPLTGDQSSLRDGADMSRELWLAAEPAAVAHARAHVARLLRAWEVDDDCVDDAVLLVSEIAANVVEHTAARTFAVRVHPAVDRIVVAVEESTSSGMPEPDTHVLVDFAPAPTPTSTELRGRGLKIVEALAASWGISRTHRRTSTWFAVVSARPLPLRVVNPGAAAELAATQAVLQRTRFLLTLTDDLADAVTAREVGQVVTNHLGTHVGATFTGIALIDAPGSASTTQTMTYLDLSVFPEETRQDWTRFPLSSDSPPATVARTGTAEFHSDSAAADADHPGLAAHMATAGTGAIAHVPLVADGWCLGTMALAWSASRTFDADTRALLSIVAGYAAQALVRRDATSDATALARRRLAEAHAGFDAALAEGASLHVLSRHDDEVRRATAALKVSSGAAAPRR